IVRGGVALLTAALLGTPLHAASETRVAATHALAERFGAWWVWRPRALHAFVLLALSWSGAYLAWRIGFSTRGASVPLWVALLVAELYGLWNLATLAWMSWETDAPRGLRLRWGPPAQRLRDRGLQRQREREHVRVAHGQELPIDVYVCTYDEPLHVLEATLAGCSLLEGEHTTYVLDDGRREEVRELAERWGAAHITRADNSDAKAGNINHALRRTGGELVLVLDADHVPLPDALRVLRAGFEDDALALVQSPHDFSNHDSVQHYGVGRHEQSLFFDVLCPGKDRHGAAYWCGSGALIRRSALLAIGGVATETIAEDFHTTMKLHGAGWRTRYERRTVLQGRAPHDLASYLLQRDRWARGNLAVFATEESPLRARGLTGAQRLSYLASLTGYLAGPMRLVLLGVLGVVLWTGLLPLSMTPLAIGVLWAPATLLSMLAGSALCRGRQSVAECGHYELCTAEIFTRALRCVLRPGVARFEVTPKEGVDHGGWEAVRRFKLLLSLTALLALGLVARVATDLGAGALPPLHGFASWFVPLLALVELRRVLRTLTLVARHRQLRGAYRTPLEVSAIVRVEGDGEAERGWQAPPRARLLARVLDVTATGIGFELASPLEAGSGARLSLQLPARRDGGSEQIEIDVEVRSCERTSEAWRIGAAIAAVSDEHRRWLVEYCHVIWPYVRLRGGCGEPPALRQAIGDAPAHGVGSEAAAVTTATTTAGAVTAGAVTAGAVTAGAVTAGAVTAGMVTAGAVTAGAVTQRW
ncbi:MAG: glycosyltransferase family 2 protein, partial [Solirubrobacteraceae bacterium]